MERFWCRSDFISKTNFRLHISDYRFYLNIGNGSHLIIYRAGAFSFAFYGYILLESKNICNLTHYILGTEDCGLGLRFTASHIWGELQLQSQVYISVYGSLKMWTWLTKFYSVFIILWPGQTGVRWGGDKTNTLHHNQIMSGQPQRGTRDIKCYKDK